MDPPPSPLPRSRRPVLVFPGHLLLRSRRTVRCRGAVVPSTAEERSSRPLLRSGRPVRFHGAVVAEEQQPYFLEIDPLDLPCIQDAVGGECKDLFWRVVAHCTAGLPEDKPQYVMGVGYPLDIVVCSASGADMYDYVYPTRTACFGSALVPEGVLKLKQNAMATDEFTLILSVHVWSGGSERPAPSPVASRCYRRRGDEPQRGPVLYSSRN